ncbi:MUTL-like protein 1 [Perilla frutescens var. frutescens]|nr:MUTL-like protein 1 [Perilla frutescens var. frutescens]
MFQSTSGGNGSGGGAGIREGFVVTIYSTAILLKSNDILRKQTALKHIIMSVDNASNEVLDLFEGAIEIVYAATLPKASKPFIYMSIKLPSEHIDVNVHRTKREVSLLNQEIIIEKI